jgi:hypothetical protein
MHLIDVDVIGLKAPKRGADLQDPVAAGIPEDLPVLPFETGFGGDDDA